MKFRKIRLAMLMLIPTLVSPIIGHAAECEGPVSQVKAVSLQGAQYIDTVFSSSTPNLEPLMSTTFEVDDRRRCVIARFSTQARVTDNHIFFQVLIDGVPMEGHINGVPGFPVGMPIVFTNMEDYEEQIAQFPRTFAHSFFLEVKAGTHTIEVLTGAGSGIDPTNLPTVTSPVLTLEY